MPGFRSIVLYDRRDHVLLSIVNAVLNGEYSPDAEKRRFFPYLHPRGIKEMAESRGIRIARSVIHILESLEIGKFEDRLQALRSLKDEVLNATTGPIPKNTARALLQIMKEVVRAHGNYTRQLELAHDFRLTVTGKPRIVRAQLRRYHLLEMPEEWNQVSFDDHVHDVNTKGRKSATHLIMDAWIKGIRHLRVIYYNYIEPRSAAELQEAAEIMGISVRIGIEFSAVFRGRFVKLIWAPRGFPDSQSFLCFLAEARVQEMMDEGRLASRYQQKHVLEVLRRFNEFHRINLNHEYEISLEPVNEEKFLESVGAGQASLIHLAKYIHNQLLPLLKKRVQSLRDEFKTASFEKRAKFEKLVEKMNRLDIDAIHDQYLYQSTDPGSSDSKFVKKGPDIPPLLLLPPIKLLRRLKALHAGFRVTLKISDLCLEDVIELLYDCEGIISRLEIFNLKDFVAGKTSNIPSISAFQVALNDGNVIALKKLIRKAIDRLNEGAPKDRADRVEKLSTILHDIDTLKSLYQGSILKSRIGSDSTGHSPKTPGMGLAVVETLPPTSQKEATSRNMNSRAIIPIQLPVLRKTTHISHASLHSFLEMPLNFIRKIHGLKYVGFQHWEDWEPQHREIRMSEKGNIITLGGAQPDKGNELSLQSVNDSAKHPDFSWTHFNSNLKNTIKILLGFIPAFLTFWLNYDWWVLAYMGAFIWFGITGFRNIIQSVLGGGGFRRSPLLKWNDYVSWDRISDSLFFTGWSVPLLDLLVKTLLLDRLLGVTTTTHPIVLYSCIALANGVYLSSHNVFRGLPRKAAYWNFFRSVLSIPVAIAFNEAIAGTLAAAGVANPGIHLQKWAAVISKTASDVVAGIIEGAADRDLNVRLRLADYRAKISRLFDEYAKLEVLLPQAPVLQALSSVESGRYKNFPDAMDLRMLMILHSLDLLYFWMYQPRARVALKMVMSEFSDEERQIFLQSQKLLKNEREIGQMFLDGLIGRHFSRGLSFYLDRSGPYLEDVEKLLNKIPLYEEKYSDFCPLMKNADEEERK